MANNEHLHSKEVLSFTAMKESFAESELTHEDAEFVFEERTGMLKSIEGTISARLREALHIKIGREKEALLEMIEDDTHAHEMHQKRNKVLDFTYFKKKPLNLRRI